MPFTRISFSYAKTVGEEHAHVEEIGIFDADGDGDEDLIVPSTLYPIEDRGVPVHILVNDGLGAFADGTSAFLPNGPPKTITARQIQIADLNSDARPDVFVADHGFDAEPFPGTRNTLILSSGAHGLIDASGTLPDVKDFSHSATVGDIDGDDDVDILVMNTGGGTPPSGSLLSPPPYFLLNNGFGSFTRVDDRLPADIASLTLLNLDNYFTASLLFDADGDDDLDLFLGSHGTTNHSLMIFNDGRGDFSDSPRRLLPDGPFNEAPVVVDSRAMDVNGDGAHDLVLSTTYRYTNHYIQILVNDGEGHFADETTARLPQTLDDSAGIRRIHLADMNGDGFVDLVASNVQYPPIFLNDGAGHFVNLPHSEFDYGGLLDSRFDIHIPLDANGDGRVDLLLSRFNGSTTEFRGFVFLQQDPGSSLSGSTDNDGLMGDADAEIVAGLGGNDVLFGGGGNDTLDAGDGADYLNGGAGDDSLVGGSGDDTFMVSDAGDVVVETNAPGDGVDTVQATVSYILGANLENLALIGSAPLDGMGNVLGNTITGNASSNALSGEGGNDTLVGAAGNDILDGGAGTDTAAYTSTRAAYTVPGAASGTVTGPDGTDTVTGIERYQFSDRNLAFDLGLDQAAGNTARIIGAAFDAPNIGAHPDWVGFGLGYFDTGQTMQQVCELVVGLLGLRNEAFVTVVYGNVVNATPSPQDHAAFVEMLSGSGGTMTQAELLELAANHPMNEINVNLVGLQASGVEFV